MVHPRASDAAQWDEMQKTGVVCAGGHDDELAEASLILLIVTNDLSGSICEQLGLSALPVRTHLPFAMRCHPLQCLKTAQLAQHGRIGHERLKCLDGLDHPSGNGRRHEPPPSPPRRAPVSARCSASALPFWPAELAVRPLIK